ncbi:MoaF-related domain-containing protein [Erythrobacter sp. GH1-10]|uniref:MoaF-related domain-containing protein n=1 Tax=Erythrobacter sp. GH1-10 TaxID=3349334 RepID=UPI003877BBFC
MGEQLTKALDGKRLNYTYAGMGTVTVQFNSGKLSFEWIEGPHKGQSGEGFDYRARQVGEGQFFVNWHEPETRGFVTLYLDLKNNFACSSVLAAYATDDEQVLFDSATINSAEEL